MHREFEFCIMRRDSGITFRFHPYDAFLKLEEEKTSRRLLPSSFPSYGSPLRQVVDDEFICWRCSHRETRGGTPELLPLMGRYDWKTLHNQIDWITANEKISRLPITGMFDKSSASKREKYKRRGLIVNHMVVTDCSWFVSQQQLFGNCYGDGRIREMTMHFNFNQNAVYREIIERQTRDFEKKH